MGGVCGAWRRMEWIGAEWDGMQGHAVAWNGMAQHDGMPCTAQHGVEWYSMNWHGTRLMQVVLGIAVVTVLWAHGECELPAMAQPSSTRRGMRVWFACSIGKQTNNGKNNKQDLVCIVLGYIKKWKPVHLQQWNSKKVNFFSDQQWVS